MSERTPDTSPERLAYIRKRVALYVTDSRVLDPDGLMPDLLAMIDARGAEIVRWKHIAALQEKMLEMWQRAAVQVDVAVLVAGVAALIGEKDARDAVSVLQKGDGGRGE